MNDCDGITHIGLMTGITSLSMIEMELLTLGLMTTITSL